MRIVGHTDDLHWDTGFGIEMRNILQRLKKTRPEWEIGAVHWKFHGTPFPDGWGVMMMPDSGINHFETAKQLIQGFQPDIYMTLYDIFVSGNFMPQLSHKSNEKSKTKWLSYFVWDIERWSAPRDYQGIFDRCDLPVAMSMYGRDSVLEAYGHEVPFIHHGVDPAQWPEIPKDLIQERREKYGNPDFVLGAFFRNINRKQVPRLIQAWSRISREYRDVQLILNMRPEDSQGFDIVHYLHHFNMLSKSDKDGNILERGPVRIGQQQSEIQGVPIQELNLLYQVCDAQVLPTMGEGFGKPIIEGYQASGLPVIMTNNTTYPELVGDHGLPVETEGYMWTRHEGAQTIPRLDSLEDQIRLMIDDQKLRKKFQAENKEFVKQFNYDDKIAQWIRMLESNVS